jgi:hypothetical protein
MMHEWLERIDDIPWWVWAVVGIVGTLGTIRLIHRGLGFA